MIGETVYIYDGNYRVFEDDNGNRTRYANRRLHWRPVVITGETRRSWIFTYGGTEGRIDKKTCEIGGRVSKNPGISNRAYMSEQEMLDAVYVEENIYRISQAVRDLGIGILRRTNGAVILCRDANKLRQIAAILDEQREG